jgi:hypothetical protein
MTLNSNQKIHDSLATIFAESAPYAGIKAEPKPFTLELLEKGLIKITVGSSSIQEHIASWIPLASRYWGLVLGKPESQGAFPSFSSDCLEIYSNQGILKNLKISKALFDMSRTLLEQNQKSAAEECAWAATIHHGILSYSHPSKINLVPEPFQKKCQKLIENIGDLSKEVWEGRSSMSKKMLFKQTSPLLKKYRNNPYYLTELLFDQGVDFFSYVSQTAEKTGKAIDDLIKEYVLDIAENAVGIVQYGALEVLEHWVVDIYLTCTRFSNPTNRDTLFFYERSLEYIDFLIENGVSEEGLFLFKWESHLALGHRDQAKTLWDSYSKNLPIKFPLKQGWIHCTYLKTEEDVRDYKVHAIARVAICIAKQRKINAEQKAYCLELAQEAELLYKKDPKKFGVAFLIEEVVGDALQEAFKLR